MSNHDSENAQASSIGTPGGFASDELARLADLKTAAWTAVHEQRPKDFLTLADALGDACEDFRRRHFPKAREVFVICDRRVGQPLSIYRRTPTGRPVLVYEEATR